MKLEIVYDKNNKKAYEDFCKAYVDQLKAHLSVVTNGDKITYGLELPIFNTINPSPRHDIKIKQVNEQKEMITPWNLENLHS
jgi:hypothetical protein